jgi:hypothetical protein
MNSTVIRRFTLYFSPICESSVLHQFCVCKIQEISRAQFSTNVRHLSPPASRSKEIRKHTNGQNEYCKCSKGTVCGFELKPLKGSGSAKRQFKRTGNHCKPDQRRLFFIQTSGRKIQFKTNFHRNGEQTFVLSVSDNI